VWVTIGVVGALSAVVAIWQAQEETQEQVDYQMQQVARIMADQPFPEGDADTKISDPEIFPNVHVHHDKDDDLIVSVRDEHGRLLYASHSNKHLPGKTLPDFDQLGFQTREIGRGAFRVFAARSENGLKIQVAQSMDVIREAQAGIAAATLLPIGLLLPLLAIVLAWAIRKQLRPLKSTTAAIASRPPLSLDLLPAEGLPAVGTSWKYSFRDQRYSQPEQIFTIRVVGVEGWDVRESFDLVGDSVESTVAKTLRMLEHRLEEEQPYVAEAVLTVSEPDEES